MSSDNLVLRYKRLSRHAFPPSKSSSFSAGFDLFSAYDVPVPARGKALILTDLQLHIPSGCYGRIAPRSGLALYFFIDVGAGVVDADYRGNVGVLLFNFGEVDFLVHRGDRVAQLICERIAYPDLEELGEDASLDVTERGSGGFGSSGLI